ncbi:glycosyltransferase [Pseudodesulfovibrio indicus]|uniref:glycosyltransferase family protein n=1 Tax=Pseudodesulfovibrio indicus TaxID=1716143 RepID=UPI00292F8785|nr:glycosyltransferase [Pseudodesulfovibrio indicus]
MSAEPTMAWIGGGYLHPQFAECGYDVRRVALSAPRVLDWDAVCRETGCEPDFVVYADASLPPPLVGLEQFPCPTLFYCVDSHIHEWYPFYAQAFDLCAVSLLDHLPRMTLRLGPDRVFWLPPFPIRGERPPKVAPKRIWDVLFVGRVDPETSPVRARFLTEFAAEVDRIEVREGTFANLFPKARIVLNIAERGDLNFRVFEALATGACLLTPRVGNGQDRLFEDGVHLFTYAQNDPRDAARKANWLLAHPELCERAGLAGLAEIDAHHRRRNRVRTILDHIEGLDREAVVRERLAQADMIRDKYLRLLYLHWGVEVTDARSRELYLKGARGDDKSPAQRPQKRPARTANHNPQEPESKSV